ncbi:hypothetical protein F2Q69_00012392 [Brassica cretica]|uniref:Uncharacterized protein n=1 Tax=Brassica cretica TaxID=69181 RepID=A0A8S9QZ27_BRACR|nr:hypothetical protein F2Q69_00012392 [Brassica cretica]
MLIQMITIEELNVYCDKAERVKDRASSYWKPSSHALIVYLCDTVVEEFRRKFNASLSAPFVVLIAPVTQNEFVATHIRLPAITFNAFVKLQRHAPPVQISPNYPDPTPSAPTTTATMPASVLSTVPPTSTLQFTPVPSSVSRAPMTSVSLTKSTLLGQKNKDVQLMCVIFVLKLGKGPSGKPYSARYIRTLVIDFSQDFVVRWRKRIIWSPDSTNIQLAKIHPKVALYIGRKEEMEKLDDVFERFMSFSVTPVTSYMEDSVSPPTRHHTTM